MLNQLTIKNYLVKNKENTHLEFKKTFYSKIKSYIRSIAAFANNSGGQIIFGVENKPRKPVGLGNDFDKFNDFDNKELITCIQNCLSHNIYFEMDFFEQEINSIKIIFGNLTVKEANQKPVICKVSEEKENLREGAIYYRYNAKNEEIKAQDLINLIQNEKDKEKQLWLKHLQKITQVGVENAGVFSYDGEIFAGNHKIIIDKEAIAQIKFIKEGNFVEKEGSPALILKGKIENIESLEVVNIPSDPNKTHIFEGLKSVEKELEKYTDIEFVERKDNKDKLNKYCLEVIIDETQKSYTLAYVLQSIIKFKNFSSVNNPDLIWANEKQTIKKYSQKFIDKIKECITNKQELNQIFN